MGLTEARDIANGVRFWGKQFPTEKLEQAYDRLKDTETNGGVRNSERAMKRLQRDLDVLLGAIADRVAP